MSVMRVPPVSPWNCSPHCASTCGNSPSATASLALKHSLTSLCALDTRHVQVCFVLFLLTDDNEVKEVKFCRSSAAAFLIMKVVLCLE